MVLFCSPSIAKWLLKKKTKTKQKYRRIVIKIPTSLYDPHVFQKAHLCFASRRYSNKRSRVNTRHSSEHIAPCHIQPALPFVFPITKLITSFLHDCVNYKDTMDLLEGKELSL